MLVWLVWLVLAAQNVAAGLVLALPVRVSHSCSETPSGRPQPWAALFRLPCCAGMLCYNALRSCAESSKERHTHASEGRREISRAYEAGREEVVPDTRHLFLEIRDHNTSHQVKKLDRTKYFRYVAVPVPCFRGAVSCS